MEGEIRVTLIATGFDDTARHAEPMIRPTFGYQRGAQEPTDRPQVMPRAMGDTGQARVIQRSPLGASRPRPQPGPAQAPTPTTFRSPLGSNAPVTQPQAPRPGGSGSARGSRTPMPKAVSPEGGAHATTRDMFGVKELELPTFIRRFTA